MLTPTIDEKVWTTNGPIGLQSVFESTLKCKELVIRTALAGEPLVYLLEDDFTEAYMKERRRKDIHLRSLRFSDKPVDKPQHTDHVRLGKEVRIVPSTSHIEWSFVIWDNNVAAVNTEGGIQVIWTNDPGYAATMKSWYDLIWDRLAIAE
mgnify:CR=1 FL=1